MTADKLSQSLYDLLDANKPDTSISVRHGRDSNEIEFPCLVVDCGEPQPHSLAMPGVNRIPVSIVLRCNFGDEGMSHEVVSDWADSIEKLVNNPDVLKTYIGASGNGIQCDYIHLASGGSRWEDSTYECVFNGDALVVRTA